jgi:hypothetical protein
MPSFDDREDSVWEQRGLALGTNFRVLGSLDNEARGNWGRVVEADSLDPASTGNERRVAIKIMRARHLGSGDVYKMFGREARILERFGLDVSAVRLLATGMIRKPNPAEIAQVEMSSDVDDFTSNLLGKQRDGWRPFLVLQLTPFSHTLLCRLQQVRSVHTLHLNAMVPLWEAISITAEGLDLLEKCHKQQLYFIDHKPEHVVWHNDLVRFLDWNGGEWGQEGHTGSFPQGLVHTDIMNFIGYVAFPLFATLQLDNRPVRPLFRGTSHPPPPTTLADGEILSFYEADRWLDTDLKKLLSRPFWSAKSRYPSAKAMADELRGYLDKWMVEGLFERLADVLSEVDAAQQSLHRAQAQMRRLCRLTEKQRNTDLPITMEVNRIRKHLQTFVNQQVLTREESDG